MKNRRVPSKDGREGGILSSSTDLSDIIYSYFTCRVLMHGTCRIWSWLIEHSVLSCFTLSCSTVFTEVSFVKPEYLFIPLFKATPYSTSWVKNL